MSEIFEEEKRTFEALRAELAERSHGQFVLIKRDRLLGVYPTWQEAVSAGYDLVEAGLGGFLVRPICRLDEEEKFMTCYIGGAR